MSRQTKGAIRVLAIVYIVATILGCIALTFNATKAGAQRLMASELLDIPFYPNLIKLTGWKLMGGIGAMMFAGRWVVQFFYARKAGRPVTPLVFWIMSLIGSNMQLIYFIWSPKQDMVGVIANFLPTFVAVYNLFLELKNRSKDDNDKGDEQGPRLDVKVDLIRKEQPPVLKTQAPVVQIAAQETAAGE